MSDVETELLALAARVTRLEEQADPDEVAKLHEKLDVLLADRGVRPPNIHWPDLEPADRDELWTGLLEWTQNVLADRYPRARRALRPCWWQHADAVDVLTACWCTWAAAYRVGNASATDAADWHRIHLPALLEQLEPALSMCDQGHDPSTSPPQAMATVPARFPR